MDYTWFGWLGLILIHGSRIPQIFFMLKSKRASGLSLSGTAAVQAGLLAYLLYAVAQGDEVFIVSNSIGMFFQGFILVLNYLWRDRSVTDPIALALASDEHYDGGFYLRENS